MSSPVKLRTALLRSARLLSEEINILLEPYQLNYSLWQVIYRIREHQGSTSIAVAKYLQVSKPSIAKRVQVLIQMNILEQVDSEDKREKRLILSEHGHSVYKCCSEKIDLHEQSLFSSFDYKAFEQTIHTLNQVLAVLESSKLGEAQ